jgi:hypothetical protein
LTKIEEQSVVNSKKLRKILDSHISSEAKVTINKWKGYLSQKKQYDITQIKSNVPDFFEINIIIYQLKVGLRSVYFWRHEGHIEKYLDEYNYRLNSYANYLRQPYK